MKPVGLAELVQHTWTSQWEYLFFPLQYTDKEEVVLWMNTVGPYHNRQETYKYFSLPFCAGSKKTISHYHETLGEALQGVELEFSGLDIKFKGILLLHWHSPVEHTWTHKGIEIIICHLSLNIWVYCFPHLFFQCNQNNVVFVIPVDEVMQTTYCEIDLDKAKRDAFVYAIKNHYWYQMYIDDLPIWGKWHTFLFFCFY